MEVLEREAAFEGYFRIDRYRLRHEQFAGGMGPPLTREVLERGQVAAVLPVDAAARRVVLIEQFRPGALAVGWTPWLLECVAGIIESGETADTVVCREAEEEAGCTIRELLPVARFLTSPGASSESVSLFLGRVDAAGAGGIHGLAHEGEDIRVTTLGFQDAYTLNAQGRVVNAKTIIALQWLELNESRVMELWGG